VEKNIGPHEKKVENHWPRPMSYFDVEEVRRWNKGGYIVKRGSKCMIVDWYVN